SPLTVTVFPAPTLAVVNVALPVQVTSSAPTTPLSAQLASVALVVPSYDLSVATTTAVTGRASMAAVVAATRGSTPTIVVASVQLVIVAPGVPSYTLFAAATVGVTVAVVIAAIVVAPVDANVYFAAAAPVSVRPLTVTVFPAPTLAVANTAAPVQLTTSPLRT